jgi:DNA-binding CsgD family transcriptional regulator/PAS domain-containing protein
MEDYSISPTLNELLLALSRGPVSEPPWQDFLRLLGRALNADYATLILRPPREGDTGVVINSVVLSAEIYTEYNEEQYALDPFVDLPPGEVYTIDEFMPLQDYYESEYYQQYVKATGIAYLMGADMWDELGNSARLRLARKHNANNFGGAERELCKLLLPHLQQTLRLHARIERLDSERALFSDAVDQLAVGTIILDESTQIRRTNKAARELLETGHWLRDDSGRLQVGKSDENTAFRVMLEEVMVAHRRAEPAFVRVFRLRGDAGSPGPGILLRPLPLVEASDGSRNPSVAIFISDPGKPRETPREVLMQLFGFTRAEARLAMQLAQGATLDEAAENLHISRNTVKSHLSSVFSKTGVARQANLVQLILRSVAPMG